MTDVGFLNLLQHRYGIYNKYIYIYSSRLYDRDFRELKFKILNQGRHRTQAEKEELRREGRGSYNLIPLAACCPPTKMFQSIFWVLKQFDSVPSAPALRAFVAFFR